MAGHRTSKVRALINGSARAKGKYIGNIYIIIVA